MLPYFRVMRNNLIFIIALFSFVNAQSQTLEKRLPLAMKRFTNDAQLKHAIASLTVADITGKIIYHLNDEYGLAPASNMKVFTSIAAFDLLGEDFRYKTEIGFTGNINDSVLDGDLYIVGNGDPTTGSWRYAQTQPDSLLKELCGLLRKKGISTITGQIILDGSHFSPNAIPGGWSWEDMGNYYGAGAWGLNWHENQYDMQLKPGKRIGDKPEIVKTEPKTEYTTFINNLTTAARGSGDNSLIYLPPNNQVGIIEGSIPAGGLFTVSGSLPEPYTSLITALQKGFTDNGIVHEGGFQTSADFALQNKSVTHYDSLIDYIYSPSLDSMIYFFMKKSINLYGEDFIKTIALQKTGLGSTDDGAKLIKTFWTNKGIESSALKIKDGSGLSAETRVTTDALVKALLYARSRSWFSAFYDALPVVNNMHMKTGTISGVKAFSGYQKASNGKEYVFSIIVNNYDGSTVRVIDKMYDVLNELKK